jgi:hypothetical protein
MNKGTSLILNFSADGFLTRKKMTRRKNAIETRVWMMIRGWNCTLKRCFTIVAEAPHNVAAIAMKR